MNIFELVKENVTARQVAERYGCEVDRHNMICCPFHDDSHPSMKVDDRYYCFGCHATGDAVDLASHLLGLKPRDAAVRIAYDFGLSNETPVIPFPSRRVAQQEEQHKRQWLRHAADVLTEYARLLSRWREVYCPRHETDKFYPLYVEALRQGDRIQSLLDIALCSDRVELDGFYRNYQEEVDRIERRISAYRGDSRGHEPTGHDREGQAEKHHKKLSYDLAV